MEERVKISKQKIQIMNNLISNATVKKQYDYFMQVLYSYPDQYNEFIEDYGFERISKIFPLV